jgi:MoxR-vWA-beta-propeller ternary system protein
MSSSAQFQITWLPREQPLVPVAVAAQGESARRLAERLLQLDDDALAHLEGVAGKDLIVVQGRTESLPWVDGVQYLGASSSTPSLLLPTNYAPALPEILVERALLARASTTGNVAILPDPLTIVPLNMARPISRPTLAVWLERT